MEYKIKELLRVFVFSKRMVCLLIACDSIPTIFLEFLCKRISFLSIITLIIFLVYLRQGSVSKLSSECCSPEFSLSLSCSDLNRRQLELDYEQALAKIGQLENEVDGIEQKLMTADTHDYVLLIQEREALLLQLQRSMRFERDRQKKVHLFFASVILMYL